MKILPFDQITLEQIELIVQYSNENVYQIDEVLDMMHDPMPLPGEHSNHLVLFPIGQWVYYYIVDHPQHGYCHYFQIRTDARGNLPDKARIEYIMTEFGITQPLQDHHFRINQAENEIKVVIPFKN
jgi:hypothetical protein